MLVKCCITFFLMTLSVVFEMIIKPNFSILVVYKLEKFV